MLINILKPNIIHTKIISLSLSMYIYIYIYIYILNDDVYTHFLSSTCLLKPRLAKRARVLVAGVEPLVETPSMELVATGLARKSADIHINTQRYLCKSNRK